METVYYTCYVSYMLYVISFAHFSSRGGQYFFLLTGSIICAVDQINHVIKQLMADNSCILQTVLAERTLKNHYSIHKLLLPWLYKSSYTSLAGHRSNNNGSSKTELTDVIVIKTERKWTHVLHMIVTSPNSQCSVLGVPLTKWHYCTTRWKVLRHEDHHASRPESYYWWWHIRAYSII